MRPPFTIALDFDGVVHSYTSGWKGAAVVADPPVEGAIEWIVEAVGAGCRVVLHTCRFTIAPSELPEATAAVRAWLAANGMPAPVVAALVLWTGAGKPHAHVYVDDNGYRFEGAFPSLAALKALRPWNRR